MSSGASSRRKGLHAIAIFEATKGVAALAGLIGVLDLLHHDARAMVMTLIGRFGLEPTDPYPSMLLHYADLLPETNIQMLVSLSSAYISLRFIEATGLWLHKAWGEYLGALSGGIYIPFELDHLIDEPSVLNVLVVLINVIIVAYLVHALWRRRHP